MRSVGLVLLLLGLVAAPAQAGTVLVLGEDGRVRAERAPGVAATGETRGGAPARPSRVLATAAARKKRRTVPGELRRMLIAGAIDEADHDERRAAYESAKKLVKRLPGRRRVEMGAAVKLLERAAAEGWMTVSRLGPLWETLRVNRKWWTTAPLLAPGRRVRAKPSEVIWQYVPGQGLHFHPLANFGRLNGLWEGKEYDDRLEVLMDELLAMAVDRGGGLAWEYHFAYGGGRAPWVSGLSQGTALQALARASIRLQRKDEVLPIAREGLRLFELAPPTGVRVRIGNGAHYLLYSFNRRLRVLNGFIQALVGLNDFALYANDARARALFEEGDREARREIPRFDTGFWSYYSRMAVTRESDLGYHRLVTGFLARLCERTAIPVYCDANLRFDGYLREPPKLEVVSQRLRGGATGALRFRVSKISHVSVRVARRGRLVLQRGGRMSHGTRSIAWAVPRKPGEYVVRVTATDLAGNTGTTRSVVEVLKSKRKRKRK